MKVHFITAAFCKADQLAHAILKARHELDQIDSWAVVGCHYPINRAENMRRLKMIAEAANCIWLDPGEDLGSAQSQNWAIKQLGLGDDDFIVNLDPDAASAEPGWLQAMKDVMEADPLCALVHLNNPYVNGKIVGEVLPVEKREVGGRKIAIPLQGEMFNMTMWRVSFLKKIGGILQMHRWYGQVELPMYMAAREHKMWNGYLTDFMETEIGRGLEDQGFRQWKYDHVMQTFQGKFGEWCELRGVQ